jgi:phage FluMu protein Com
MPERQQNGLLPVHCWRCKKLLMELEPGASGWAVKVCSRCKRRNLVTLETGQTGR